MTRNAVITGGAGGIGREMALLLARRGARVVLADVDRQAAERTAAEVSAAGGEGLAVACDVRDAAQIEALASRAKEALGRIDLWVNNAGVLVTGELDRIERDAIARVVDINLWGVVHGCQQALPILRRQPLVHGRRGALLNVASLAGAIPLPFMGPYNATKAAVIALSETLAAELANDGVTVTILCPSFTQTRLIDAAEHRTSEATTSAARRIMRHLGARPRDVAALGLRAAERGRLYAVPTLHGRLAWRAKRLAPRRLTQALAFAHRFVREGEQPAA